MNFPTLPGKYSILFWENQQESTRSEYSIIHGLNYDFPSHPSSLYPSAQDGVPRPLNGDRGIGGKFPKEGVQSPGACNPTVAGVTGVRVPPTAGALPSAYKPRESPSPAHAFKKLPVLPEGVRWPERRR